MEAPTAPGVVRARPDEAHGENGVVRHLGVGVVRELAERVQDVELGVGDGAEGEGERHGATDHRLAVAQKVAELPERHLRPDVFPHRDQRDSCKRRFLVGLLKLKSFIHCEVK